MELTNDISDELQLLFAPLSAPQPVFKHGYCTFSNALLLHRLVATGQGEQVVSRRGELNRELVKRTCEYKYKSWTYSKVR